MNKHSWSKWSCYVYQVHVLTAWHQNQDSQWHDLDVEWCQQDQHWIESYINNIEYCLNVFTERNKEKEHDYTSFKSNIKSTKHFDFEKLILEVN